LSLVAATSGAWLFSKCGGRPHFEVND
jgi:hypothetical protein